MEKNQQKQQESEKNMEMVIKVPETEEEMNSMWKLNCDVFCRELGLHPIPENGMLVDRFHGRNFYRIAWDGTRVCAMICAHTDEPFSVVGHFGDVMAKEIISEKTGEIRLFAMVPEYRTSLLSAHLTSELFKDLRAHGVEKLVISGVENQVRLYRHMGFKIIGEPVQDGDVLLYPLVADIAVVEKHLARAFSPYRKQAQPTQETGDTKVQMN